MWTWLKQTVGNLLFDEAAGQRAVVFLLALLGQFLKSGGVVPLTDLVVPGVSHFANWGGPLQAVATGLAAGNMLPLRGPQPKP